MKKLASLRFSSEIVQYLLITILTVSIIFISSFTYSLWQNQQNDHANIRTLIASAVEDLYKPTVVDAKERTQYFYEASVHMPVDSKLPTFSYHYAAADESGLGEKISITTRSVLSTGITNLGFDKTVIDRVPDLQRCTRMFVVTFQPEEEPENGLELVSSKFLTDSREVSIYKRSDCANSYLADVISQDHDALLELVSKIDSY